MTIPCPKPSDSFLLVQNPSSFTDPSISPNSISNHIPPYLAMWKDAQNTPFSTAYAIPYFLLWQNSTSVLRPPTDSLVNISAAPGQSGWYEPLILQHCLCLCLDFPPLMAVRDMCPSLGRASHRGKERTQHILITTSVLSKAKCLTRRSLHVCETEEKCTFLLPRSRERESSLYYNAPSTIHKHIVSIRRKIFLPITPPHQSTKGLPVAHSELGCHTPQNMVCCR